MTVAVVPSERRRRIFRMARMSEIAEVISGRAVTLLRHRAPGAKREQSERRPRRGLLFVYLFVCFFFSWRLGAGDRRRRGTIFFLFVKKKKWSRILFWGRGDVALAFDRS